MLPEIKKVIETENYFPTPWQTVIFRNYGYVQTCKLASVLRCDECVIEEEARRLGLKKADENRVVEWERRGYITIIRNNWYLLPYEQLLALLGISEKRLEFILANDDFLSVKLGDFKPFCEEIYYSPLSAEQIERTNALANEIKPLLEGEQKAPFEFFGDAEGIKNGGFSGGGKRIVHGYLSPCGDAFMENDEQYLPNSLLAAYKNSGVNGIWFHGLLSALSPYPFDEAACVNYKTRRKNLQKLINRCEKYGVRVYLYLNEPRGLKTEKLGKYACLAGRIENGVASLCWEHDETKEYLYNAVKDLLENVHGLGGFITITMSENLTHCNYKPETNCPICKSIPPEKTAAEINNVIAKAAKDSAGGAEVIANLWGWSPFMGWTEEQTMRGVELLDKNVSIMCVSEYDLQINKGGVNGKVIDYSISNVGPSEITIKTLKKAKAEGHKLYAKIQVNNSWECSAVPCLPVFDLIYEHLKNLHTLGVNDYMLTWTLGGCPSEALAMASEFSALGDSFDLSEWYTKVYGEQAQSVHNAVRCFCDAFKEYPFSIDSLYFSPKTLGEANFYSLKKQGLTSTMVCYAFDDYNSWIKPYPPEIYLSQYKKLLALWADGMQILSSAQNACSNAALRDLSINAEGAYLHFYSDYLQTRFSILKSDVKKNKSELIEILNTSLQNCKRLINIVHQDAKIGFEASNHYFYTDRSLVEKVLNLKALLNALKNA